MNLSLSRVQAIVGRFASQRVVVIGDVMLDHQVVGDARRISPEAPVPVVQFRHETNTAGGAANVARNLASLGARADLFGVVGDDSDADTLRVTISADGVATAGLVAEAGRPTTRKTRISAHRQQIVRIDRESSRPVSAPTRAALSSKWRPGLAGAAAVIVADYAKGVVDQFLLDELTAAAGRRHLPVGVDPKPGRNLRFGGCALLTPNRKEAFELAGLTDGDPAPDPASDPLLLQAAAAIREKHGPATLLITLSEAGLLLVEPDQPPRHIPTAARQVFDVTGAGDTVIAAYVLACAAGATPFEAAAIANHAAGIVVAKVGTATVTGPELVDAFRTAKS
ncbi:MAG TPA: PfkB family carbohydrate kinase [Opitutus sp.]|nr:PfkB family carbohydrate kinase [Opitutus sp.]